MGNHESRFQLALLAPKESKIFSSSWFLFSGKFSTAISGKMLAKDHRAKCCKCSMERAQGGQCSQGAFHRQLKLVPEMWVEKSERSLSHTERWESAKHHKRIAAAQKQDCIDLWILDSGIPFPSGTIFQYLKKRHPGTTLQYLKKHHPMDYVEPPGILSTISFIERKAGQRHRIRQSWI